MRLVDERERDRKRERVSQVSRHSKFVHSVAHRRGGRERGERDNEKGMIALELKTSSSTTDANHHASSYREWR